MFSATCGLSNYLETYRDCWTSITPAEVGLGNAWHFRTSLSEASHKS